MRNPAKSKFLPKPNYEALDRLFHEPNRLAIMSVLCSAEEKGLPFTELREACHLTDGNLNRHLKALEDGGMIAMDKKFVARKPRTLIGPTARGLESFGDYLAALEKILKTAKAALPRESSSGAAWGGLPAKA